MASEPLPLSRGPYELSLHGRMDVRCVYSHPKVYTHGEKGTSYASPWEVTWHGDGWLKAKSSATDEPGDFGQVTLLTGPQVCHLENGDVGTDDLCTFPGL